MILSSKAFLSVYFCAKGIEVSPYAFIPTVPTASIKDYIIEQSWYIMVSGRFCGNQNFKVANRHEVYWQL